MYDDHLIGEMKYFFPGNIPKILCPTYLSAKLMHFARGASSPLVRRSSLNINEAHNF